ncbi:FAD-binding oxidoreductase [Labrenzia sp. OB1]|uniref:NAD(P)/FAD-dependent oxidoreductase n=1 Tax=Labrenzia sp. OB1 TaxID=1561204 RepID=UPI0007B22C8B|nr:FAD-binding oxidoreductase [Labrenzia sp. OB1]KZM49299.1 amino acid dehydrogenase [Labrenzia sp. OB1]
MAKQAKQNQSFEVMVLGAGIVGVSTALHLRRLGLDVALIDRTHPGLEASYGNAGIVQRNGFVPHAVPSRVRELMWVLFGQSSAVSYDVGTLFRLLPWLRRYHAASGPRGAELYSRVVAPLRALAVQEHLDLARSANADRFYRQGGWLHLHRSAASYSRSDTERYYARVYGVAYEELSAGEIGMLEPGLKITGRRAASVKAVHWTESCSVSNPGAVVDAFWRTFIQEGGRYFRADAAKLQRKRGGWRLDGERGTVFAGNAVIALGAWSQDIMKALGENYPLAIKRGYHMHYRPLSGASLSRPLVDVDNGLVLTPTDNGIRLTTGVELVERDAPPNPKIVAIARRRAEDLMPLGAPLQDTPWMGSRPCLPDSLPVVGASPTIPGLWVNFGHGHDGFTLGPITGRLLAEMIAGKAPVLDPAGLSPLRFMA